MKPTVLVGGSTGYLGRYIIQELLNQNYTPKALVRNSKTSGFTSEISIIESQVTQPETLKGICKNVDYVISTIGITRQKDGLTYMDVDYQANVNLIEEAKKSGVKKFIYVSVLNGDKLTHTKIGYAKEKFVQYLKKSGISYSIIRPNGFFSDMGDFLQMAKSGRIYLFGNGEHKLNPIHGDDLAKVCIDAITNNKKEINVGGPELMSQNEIATIALQAYDKKERIIHIPDWIRKMMLWSLKAFTTSKTYGPYEFFLTTMTMDMTAPKYGKHLLKNYFTNQINKKTATD